MAYCQDEQKLYHGTIVNVEYSFIEIGDSETNEFIFVKLPLVDKYLPGTIWMRLESRGGLLGQG